MHFRITCLIVLLALAGPAVGGWSIKGEFGLVMARGNADTDTINAGLNAVFERDRWRNESSLSGVRSTDEGEVTTSRYVLGNKVDYSVNERSYVFNALRYDRDRFSNFRFQATASVGYGYRVIDGERHKLKLEGGPGVRFSEARDTDESETEAIVRGFAEYAWKITETAELTNRLLVESASDNTFLENTAAVSVAINARLSLKTGIALRRNSNVEPDRKKTDTLTTINLVYSF